jgi:hypothetical protein
LYACPEDLYPKEACDNAKVEMRIAGMKFVQQKPVKVHPIKEGRRVPLKQLIMRLKLQDYDVSAPFNSKEITVSKVKILLQQHIGVVAKATVKKSEVVKAGNLIGRVNENELGSNIHASINGDVTEVTDKYILIES